MESLVHTMLSNALAVIVLAAVVATVSRFCRRPALIHGLWLVVLIKLVTPPFISVPLPLPRSGLALEHAAAVEPPTVLAREGYLRPDNDGALRPFRDFDAASELLGAEFDRSLPLAPHALAAAAIDPSAAEVSAREPTGNKGNELRSTAIEFSPRALAGRGQRAAAAPAPRPALSAPTAALALGATAIPPWLSWEACVLAFVLSGAVGWWSLAATRITRFHCMVKTAQPVPYEWQVQTEKLAEKLGLRHRPEACLVPGEVPPMLWAIGLSPRLLLPIQLWSTLAPDERTSLLLHELAHLKRRDHWVRWLELVVAGPYWWHPVVWWARRALREAEEQCCDAWVVWAMPQGAKTYATALLAALDFVSGARTAPAAPAATSGNGHVSCLKRRLRMILRSRTPKGLSWAGRLAVAGMAALILPLAPGWGQHDKPGPGSTPLEPGAGIDSPQEPTGTPAVGAVLDAALLRGRLDNGPAASPAREAPPARLIKDDEDDDKKDEKGHDAAQRLEKDVKDLIEKLTKELGPVGEEIRKALDRAIEEVQKPLDKENPSSDEVRKALEKSQEELRRAFEQGGPVERELREAWERSRRELREVWQRSRDDLREVLRDRAEVARQRQRELGEQARERERAERGRPEAEKRQPGAGESRQNRQELENARREIRELEQQLRRANRRLEELERREGRFTTRRPATPGAEPEPPRRTVPEAPVAKPARPQPPGSPGPVRPVRPGARRPFAQPGAPGAESPRPGPDYERRMRNLEDKLNQLLRELKEMKGEQKPKASIEAGARVI
jgi:beta-lactamase regulating signal transducer with metallopeptidase domain